MLIATKHKNPYSSSIPSMNTSSFLTHLRLNSSLPLVFRSGGETLDPSFHLTEVKRVGFETVDCGGMRHEWRETHFEIWVPPSREPSGGPMAAAKFLQIVERVEADLPLTGDAPVRIFAAFSGGPGATYEVAAIRAVNGHIQVELTPQPTRCKSAERRAALAERGCCVEETRVTASQASESCGCTTLSAQEAGVSCCR